MLSTLPASAAEFYRGTFIHYEGAEYESTFVSCDSKETLIILEGSEQKALIAKVSGSPKLEVPVALELEVTPIDKNKYPHTHYTGTAKVIRIVHSKGGEEPCEVVK